MNQTDLSAIKKKALFGVGSLVRRQIAIKSLFFLGNVILARMLAPEVFGIYDIVTFVVHFFSTFGDVGLGAALIRRKGELRPEELSTTFWLQQLLVWMVAVVVIILAPLALVLYPSLPPVGVWLIRSMVVSFLLMSFKTIPSILLERNLEFNKIAWVDITEQLAYQVTAVACAVAGFGVWSFIIAAIIRGILGVSMIYALSAWRPKVFFRYTLIKETIRFGLPYQANVVMSFVKDAVTPLFVGAYAGATAVGFITWARTFAFAPLIISASFERVAFPTFSKIQHDRELLKRAIERSIRSMTLILFPITAFMVALGPDIIRIVFTEKWLPGLWTYYFYCTSPFVIGVLLPMYSAILSLGKSAVLLKMTIVLVCLEWGLGIPFVIYFGFTGIAMNQPVISGLFFFIYRNILAAEGVTVSIADNVKWQLVTALGSGVCAKVVAHTIKLNIVTAPMLFVAGCIGYLLILWTVRPDIVHDFKENLAHVIGRREG